jgi:hypothetical protein
MSNTFLYDGSGSMFMSISSLINYTTITKYVTISSYIFSQYPSISGYSYGSLTTQYITISSFVISNNDWLKDYSYNRMNSMYVNGYIDISGGIIIRQGSQFQGSDSSFFNGTTSGIQNQFNSISGLLQTQILYNQFDTYGTIFSFSNFGQCTNTYFTKTQSNSIRGDIICSSYSGQYIYFVATNIIYSSQNYGV